MKNANRSRSLALVPALVAAFQLLVPSGTVIAAGLSGAPPSGPSTTVAAGAPMASERQATPGGQQAGAGGGQQKGAPVLRVQRAEIIDQRGFEKPMVAATMMVPAGWQHSGEVLWNVGQRCGTPYAPRLQASAADGSATIELSPREVWAVSNHGAPIGDCPQVNLLDVRAYLASWVQRQREGARLVEYTPRPDKSRVIAQNEVPGSSLRMWVESGTALIAYRRDGREEYERLAAAVSFTHSRLSGGFGGQVFESLQGQAMGVLSWRTASAPVPQRHFDLVWDSLKPGPEWQARINAAEQQMAADNAATQSRISQIQAKTSRETLAHITRRGEIMNQTRQEIAEMRNETWRSGQATQERMHTDNVRTIREVQGYRNPREPGVVELSSHYNHAWQLRDGTYVLTDDPNFEPARDLGMAGEPLERTRE